MPARIANAAGHVLSTDAPADNAKLTNSGSRTAGGLENLGTQTSNEFTATETIECLETVNVPATSPPVAGTTDGLETAAGPMISVTNISIPASWTPAYTGKSGTLSGAPSAPNNAGYGTFDLFPDVKITIAAGANTISGGVGVAKAVATITGSIKELDNWVVPWNPESSTPNFDGSDFGRARSPGYGKEVGIFYITFTLSFKLLDFVDGAATASPIPLNYQIGVINNYDNDRDVYMAAYEKAYGSLTKVPELSEWQT